MVRSSREEIFQCSEVFTENYQALVLLPYFQPISLHSTIMSLFHIHWFTLSQDSSAPSHGHPLRRILFQDVTCKLLLEPNNSSISMSSDSTMMTALHLKMEMNLSFRFMPSLLHSLYGQLSTLQFSKV